MWKGYILEVLGFIRDGAVLPDAKTRIVSQAGHGSLLASADFHGMEIEVVRCRDVGRVGLKGIVVRETRGLIVVVTEGDRVRKILKRGTVFRVIVELPSNIEIETETRTKGECETKEQERTEESGNTAKKRMLIFELHGDQLEIRPVERAVRKFKWKTMDYL